MNNWLPTPISLCFTMIALFAIPTQARAQGCLEEIGRWPYGPSLAVAVEGDHAYFGSGTTLRIADITDPFHPRVVGEFRLPEVIWGGLEVYDSVAYVANRYGGLRIIDVADPTSPTEIGHFDMAGRTDDVVVVDGLAFMTNGSLGIRIIDVSNPSAPTEIGSHWIWYYARSIEIANDHAFVIDSREGLTIYDVSDPENPTLVYAPRDNSYYQDVAVSGNYAYVLRSSYTGELWVFDVSSPARPRFVGSYERYPGFHTAISISGNRAYVADYYQGLLIIDISTPSDPVELGVANTPGFGYDVFVVDEWAYLAAHSGGLRIIDVDPPSSPMETGFIDAPGNLIELDLSGDYAYVADEQDGLRIIDFSDPSRPFEVGSASTDVAPRSIAVDGDYVYILTFWRGHWGGLQIFDVARPDAPHEIGRWVDDDRPYPGLDIVGNRAYIARESHGVMVLDVSTPSNPVLIGQFAREGVALDVKVVGETAYVGGSWMLRIFDITDLAAPTETGRVGGHGAAFDLEISPGYAWTLDSTGFRVIDILDPSDPRIVASKVFNLNGQAVGFEDWFAFVGTDNFGTLAIDVRRPTSPRTVAEIRSPGTFSDIELANGIAVTADDEGGIVFYDVSGCRNLVPDGAAPRQSGARRTP